MMPDSVSFGSASWLLPAAAILAVAAGVLLRAYVGGTGSRGARLAAGILKGLGFLALASCLLEPLAVGQRARPRSNLLVVIADNSQSLKIRDRGEERSRGDLLRELLRPEAGWLARLGEDFDVRRYAFDARLRAVDGFEGLSFDGEATALGACLSAIGRQYRGRPLAGVLLLTDGIPTDLEEGGLDGSNLPPIYPILLGAAAPVRDVELRRVAVNETLFETAPVTVQAEVREQGYGRDEIVVVIVDASGKEVQKVTQAPDRSGRLTARFELRPEQAGVHFYRVLAGPRSEAGVLEEPARTAVAASASEPSSQSSEREPPGRSPLPEQDGWNSDPERLQRSSEGTLANNTRIVKVNRRRGPYRVLYVSGRPNWEFKFLRRAIEEDHEVELVGLIRIAKREPKFDYRGRTGESTNPLFRGFGKENDEDAERYDQPVLLRLGTLDADELRDGFPKSPEELFRYHAVILDDVEAEYFTQDQMSSLRSFVARRGGGFLMLGGQESFLKGGYRRTPIEEILPIYLESLPALPSGAEISLSLTREGWIQPWVRLRDTEEAERLRLEKMPPFRTLNPARGIKPGAAILAEARHEGGEPLPALVAQTFGRGRAAALLIGDLWRWSLRRPSPSDEDPARAWRQIVRWLVSDVPRRVEAEVSGAGSGSDLGSSTGSSVRIAVRVRDELHEPLENASVAVEVLGPADEPVVLTAEPSVKQAGLYDVTYDPRRAGAYRARVTARGPDGGEVGTDETGWTFEPAAREYRRLEPDRELVERLARDSGGELVTVGGLERLVKSLPHRKTPIADPWVEPLWQRWWVLLLVVLCLGGEWGLRRWKGLP